ncbi:hypothetical protein KMW28_27335 [Flammeovirga yaeyamensis]|uniref:Spindle assembly abnormal protein 6 N-terminal domain-containing protein n=1 Tax=Flammeovirga yaeyamensis TaxID=367791 RepID=A0AAX1NAX4_9BACT|nr:hypothetical protein [Flammeovirga yaeyamensis]MBB3700004.1 hypothetical protein [Flammeovirga yaeyamensis]NMF37558.1 hypothetical protein [Flammeovirga yaeyamensis]QWG04615.1 hypothetical protein KMW28_27335 [Flammeovirga yaeyamensis]
MKIQNVQEQAPINGEQYGHNEIHDMTSRIANVDVTVNCEVKDDKFKFYLSSSSSVKIPFHEMLHNPVVMSEISTKEFVARLVDYGTFLTSERFPKQRVILYFSFDDEHTFSIEQEATDNIVATVCKYAHHIKQHEMAVQLQLNVWQQTGKIYCNASFEGKRPEDNLIELPKWEKKTTPVTGKTFWDSSAQVSKVLETLHNLFN